MLFIYYIDQLGDHDIESVELEAIDLGLGNLKEIRGKWMVNMGSYIASNLQFTVNGFLKSGISGALDGHDDTDKAADEILEDADEVSDDLSDGEESLEATGTERFKDDPHTTRRLSMDNLIIN